MTQVTATPSTLTIGIDLGDRKSHVCILDAVGETVEESCIGPGSSGARKTAQKSRKDRQIHCPPRVDLTEFPRRTRCHRVALYWSTDFRGAFRRSEVPKRQADTLFSPSASDGVPRRTVVVQRVLGGAEVVQRLSWASCPEIRPPSCRRHDGRFQAPRMGHASRDLPRPVHLSGRRLGAPQITVSRV